MNRKRNSFPFMAGQIDHNKGYEIGIEYITMIIFTDDTKKTAGYIMGHSGRV